MPVSLPTKIRSLPLWGLCLLVCSFVPFSAGAQTDSLGSTPASGVEDSPPSTSSDLIPDQPHPPELNYRPPIPAPPAMSLPVTGESPPPKPPLAWRTKAYLLANERGANQSSKLAWSLPVSFDKTQVLLTSALNQTGFQLVASYAAAGHYLAIPSGGTSNTQIIIVVQPITASMTSFQLRVSPESHRREVKRIEELPKVMNTILGTRGLL